MLIDFVLIWLEERRLFVVIHVECGYGCRDRWRLHHAVLYVVLFVRLGSLAYRLWGLCLDGHR